MANEKKRAAQSAPQTLSQEAPEAVEKTPHGDAVDAKGHPNKTANEIRFVYSDVYKGRSLNVLGEVVSFNEAGKASADGKILEYLKQLPAVRTKE